MPGPVVQPWLALGSSPAEIFGELAKFRDFQRVMLVGHEPDFSAMVEACIGARRGTIDFKKGAIAALRVDPANHAGSLLYLVPPRLADGAL
jgi:phosphohistidine phosphatase SixA